MSTIAMRLREENQERLRRMTAADRVQQALTLGRAAISRYAAAHGVALGEARQRLERNAQLGRALSRVMREQVG